MPPTIVQISSTHFKSCTEENAGVVFCFLGEFMIFASSSLLPGFQFVRPGKKHSLHMMAGAFPAEGILLHYIVFTKDFREIIYFKRHNITFLSSFLVYFTYTNNLLL